MANREIVVPLHLSGNMTEKQYVLLQAHLNDAVQEAYRTSVPLLDRDSAQWVLDLGQGFQEAVAKTIVELIRRHSVSEKYKNEEAGSDRVYPPTYRVRPIETQTTELRKAFPGLGTCMEKLGHKPLPDGAEDWFAIPRWQALAPTYNEAVEMVLGLLATRRRFSNRILGRLGPTYLRQSERSKLGEKILAEQQSGNDILVIAAQAGMRHRGRSARRARVSLASNEFGLGVFAISCLLLTHPERLSSGDTLMIDCGGDEYSVRGDLTFDRVPLLDYDLSGTEFSVFYDDCARNLWGTPTAFLFKMP
jgi:hypothetical protein